MLEALVVAAATVSLFALALGVKGGERFESGTHLVLSGRDERGEDLPCPWCYSPTSEEDRRCGGCAREFG